MNGVVKQCLSFLPQIESFDTVASSWDYATPFPLAPGAETSFTMDLSHDLSLVDTPFFVAMRAHAESSCGMPPGPVSNWVRVLVVSPPPTPTMPTSSSGASDLTTWALDGETDSENPSSRFSNALDFNLDLVLPVAGGLAILAICVAVYCYMCVVRRSRGRDNKMNHDNQTKSPPGMSPSMSPTHGSAVVTPSSPNHAPLAGPDDSPGMDHKKRLSMVDPMNIHNQDIGSAPHTPQHLSPSYIGPAPLGSPAGVGHTGSLQRPRTLSPYQSWTASQLLHEHERRHSPYGDEQALPAYQYQYPQYQQHSEHVAEHAVDGAGQQYDLQYFPEQGFHAPPVPPLPHLHFEEAVYGVQVQPQQLQPQPQTHGYLHSNRLLQFNPSLQGSLSSVSSGDRKKRNVTMV